MNTKIINIKNTIIEAEGIIGKSREICHIYSNQLETVKAEIIGFQDNNTLMAAYYDDDYKKIHTGCEVELSGSPSIKIGDDLLGRVLNGYGIPIDYKGPIKKSVPHSLYNVKKDKLPVKEKLITGVKVIDAFLSPGKGQNIGFFTKGSCYTENTIEMILQETMADINVIVITGQRGKNLKDLLERLIKEDCIKKSVIIVSPSYSTSLERIRSAYTGISIAEYFRDKGKDVLLLMYSFNRFAFARRELDLISGKKPVNKGYTDGVFTAIPEILQRTGSFENGSITGFYVIFHEGDIEDDLLTLYMSNNTDCHIEAKSKLLFMDIIPEINLIKSFNKIDLMDKEQKKASLAYCKAWDLYEKNMDNISTGLYKEGISHELDWSVKNLKKMIDLRNQKLNEKCYFNRTREELIKLMEV